ncbi:MAG: DUF418 domain-containing protein [Bacteroidota bacterium]
MTISNIQGLQRFISLDVIRGIAILGILIMNIQNFSMIGQAYINPTAYGNFTGANKWVWVISHVVADQKFMTIFSILFGASILLITEKAQEKGKSPCRVHYARNFWLLIIGTVHSYILWYGDILFPYALCSFFVFFFRRLSIRKLLIFGIIIFSVASIIYLLLGLSLPYWPEDAVNGLISSWRPGQELIEQEINAYRGSLASQVGQTIKAANMMHTSVFLFFFFWRITGLMMIGMALYKSGFLTGIWEVSRYKRMLLWTAPLGLCLIIYGIMKNFDANWSVQYSMFLGSQFNYWGSLFLALGYLAAINLGVLSGKFKPFLMIFSAVGRQALSNYLFQTLICISIFYGFGLGLFGKVEQTGQIVIVMGVWIIQIIFSQWWQTKFNYGPFEWLWRSATFMKWQSFIKR